MSKKVIEQNYNWITNAYSSYKLNKINLEFYGKNSKMSLSPQYNEIVKLFTTSNSDNLERAAKTFAYNCILFGSDENKANGFVVTRDKARIDSLDINLDSYSWLKVQDIAEEKGLGTVYIGDPYNQLPSVFVMSDSLLNMIQSKDKQQAPKVKNVSPKELIQVFKGKTKEERKQRIPVGKIRNRSRFGKSKRDINGEIKRINEHNAKFTFLDANEYKIETTLQRRFYEDLDTCGRTIAPYQTIRSEQRSLIKVVIDNVTYECHEFDYGSMHPRLAYELEDIRLDEDFKPYSIPVDKCPLNGTQAYKRTVYKLAMMMLVNTKGSPHCALHNELQQIEKTVNKKIAEGKPLENLETFRGMATPSLKDCATVTREIKDLNAPINDYISKYNADFFQNYDAEIAVNVMLTLVDKNVPFLCIHDSFIVPKQHGKILEQAMFDGWEAVLGSKDCCVVDCKTKPTPKLIEVPKVEETTLDQLLLECDLKPFTKAGQLINSLSSYTPDEVRMRRLQLSHEVGQEDIERNDFLADVYGEDWRTII